MKNRKKPYPPRGSWTSRLETWSTSETNVPLGFSEAISSYGRIDPNRVVAFRFKVWTRDRVDGPRESCAALRDAERGEGGE